jgi:hypothetical protein
MQLAARRADGYKEEASSATPALFAGMLMGAGSTALILWLAALMFLGVESISACARVAAFSGISVTVLGVKGGAERSLHRENIYARIQNESKEQPSSDPGPRT